MITTVFGFRFVIYNETKTREVPPYTNILNSEVLISHNTITPEHYRKSCYSAPWTCNYVTWMTWVKPQSILTVRCFLKVNNKDSRTIPPHLVLVSVLLICTSTVDFEALHSNFPFKQFYWNVPWNTCPWTSNGSWNVSKINGMFLNFWT